MQIKVIQKKKGLGDKIESALDRFGIGPAFKSALAHAGIEDCGCKGRKELINKTEAWVKVKLQSFMGKTQKQGLNGMSTKKSTTKKKANLNIDQSLIQRGVSEGFMAEEGKMSHTKKTEV